LALGADEDDAKSTAMLAAFVHVRMLPVYEKLGDLSDTQKQQIRAVELALVRWAKANPNNTEQQCDDQFFPQLRQLLSSDQQKKLDDLLVERARRRVATDTAMHVRQIGLALTFYSFDHQYNMPPDLGALITMKNSLPPIMFLAGGSKAKVPANFDKLDPALKAEWVDVKTDFVFITANKSTGMGRAVTAYVRPSAAPDGNFFLLTNGVVIAQDPDLSQKIVAELKSGKNPPPSLNMDLPAAPEN
jgi:hypothetical protein